MQNVNLQTKLIIYDKMLYQNEYRWQQTPEPIRNKKIKHCFMSVLKFNIVENNYLC